MRQEGKSGFEMRERLRYLARRDYYRSSWRDTLLTSSRRWGDVCKAMLIGAILGPQSLLGTKAEGSEDVPKEDVSCLVQHHKR